MLLKYAVICAISGLMLLDICMEAGLASGLIKLLLEDHEISTKIIAHELMRGATMTGTDDAGGHIGRLAGKHLRKSMLEMGSNHGFIVSEAADIHLALKTCKQGRLFNNGETRVSTKRFIVTGKIYENALMPLHGGKDSGYGREQGGPGVKACVNVKAIYPPKRPSGWRSGPVTQDVSIECSEPFVQSHPTQPNSEPVLRHGAEV